MRHLRRASSWFLLLVFAAACASAPEPQGPRIETAEDLLAALQDAGIEITDSAMLASMPDLPPGRVVFLGDEQVEIYEEDSEPAQHAAVSRLLQGLDAASSPNVWAGGRVIVIYDGADGATMAVLSGLLGDSLSLPAAAPDEPYPPAVASAIGWLAETTGEDPGRVVVDTFAPADWPDACLGLPGVDEACAEVITPGWRITLRAGDRSVTLRTNDLGTVVRQEP